MGFAHVAFVLLKTGLWGALCATCHPECPRRAQRQPVIAREYEPHALFMPHPSRNQQARRVLRKFSIKKEKLSVIVVVLTSHLGEVCSRSRGSQCLQSAKSNDDHFQNKQMPEGESLQGLLVAVKGHLFHPTAAPSTKLIFCTFSFLRFSANSHPVFSDWFFPGSNWRDWAHG